MSLPLLPIGWFVLTTGFDYFRRGSPMLTLGGTNTFGFNYFRRGEPMVSLR